MQFHSALKSISSFLAPSLYGIRLTRPFPILFSTVSSIPSVILRFFPIVAHRISLLCLSFKRMIPVEKEVRRLLLIAPQCPCPTIVYPSYSISFVNIHRFQIRLYYLVSALNCPLMFSLHSSTSLLISLVLTVLKYRCTVLFALVPYLPSKTSPTQSNYVKVAGAQLLECFLTLADRYVMLIMLLRSCTTPLLSLFESLK